jgi:uncharacterized membrane-anchored protein YitT (DUF2179 family)
MSNSPIFVDTLFFYPTALTATGTTSSCVVADQDDFSPINYGFAVTVASIGTSVVVRFEGSLDGTNFFALAATDTTISANGTTGYNITNFPLKAVRARLVTINTGTPTVTFVISAR